MSLEELVETVENLHVVDGGISRANKARADLAKIEDYTVLAIVNRKCEVVYADRFHGACRLSAHCLGEQAGNRVDFLRGRRRHGGHSGRVRPGRRR